MNILFLSLSKLVRDIENRGIYPDLLRKFANENHQVYIVCPFERRENKKTEVYNKNNVHILGVKTLNIIKSNPLEKGIATLLIEHQYNSAIRRFFGNVHFDLILYSTPPVTFNKVVEKQKSRNPQAVSYLLLKDIFPQNAVDLEMFSSKSLLYRYFRKKEHRLYQLSDFIGCMSPANVQFVLSHNPDITKERVEVAPNSMDIIDATLTKTERLKIREKYHLPLDKPILIYGGNLGKPQGIDFLIRCLEDNKNRTDCFFLIIGDGTEYWKIDKWIRQANPKNVALHSCVPKDEYDVLNRACDVGLIFLDHRFLIPNYPSRLLAYLECKMPVIAATDTNSDVGKIAEENGYGYWCESVNPHDFTKCVDALLSKAENIQIMGKKGYHFLINNYTVEKTYKVIMSHFIDK